MRKEPTILFCVGATKAGTSWFYNQLAAHPECHLRSIKELRYFDTVEHDHFHRQIRRKRKAVQALHARIHLAQKRHREKLAIKLADVKDWRAVLKHRAENTDSYLDYLNNGSNGHLLVADITPSYALLPSARLRRMADLAPNTRFVYLMRDPVARLWSHVRMLGKRVAKTADAVPDACFTLLEQILRGEQNGVTERGNYKAALQRLWAAVDPSKLMVTFTEDMLTPAGFQRLCNFLGISYHGAAFDQPAHVGPVLAMSPDQQNRARAVLRPQYEFVARHFPDIPENWRKNMGEARL